MSTISNTKIYFKISYFSLVILTVL